MPNIVSVLKQEIARISKSQAKTLVAPVRKTAVSSRWAVADLKRRVASLEKANKLLQAIVDRVAASMPAPSPEAGDKARITAKGMKSLRRRLGLSADELGKLLGITGQAVYALEKSSGALRVRKATRAAILAIRGIGAREARQRLAEMPAKHRKPAVRRKAGKRK